MMINIITTYSEGKAIYNCRAKNDDYYHKGREGGGQRVMIEIIISENDGQPITGKGGGQNLSLFLLRLHSIYIQKCII